MLPLPDGSRMAMLAVACKEKLELASSLPIGQIWRNLAYSTNFFDPDRPRPTPISLI
jgi:hypothetical protein